MFVHLNIHSTYDLLYSSLKLTMSYQRQKQMDIKHLQLRIRTYYMASLSFMTHVLMRELSQYLE